MYEDMAKHVDERPAKDGRHRSMNKKTEPTLSALLF